MGKGIENETFILKYMNLTVFEDFLLGSFMLAKIAYIILKNFINYSV